MAIRVATGAEDAVIGRLVGHRSGAGVQGLLLHISCLWWFHIRSDQQEGSRGGHWPGGCKLVSECEVLGEVTCEGPSQTKKVAKSTG